MNTMFLEMGIFTTALVLAMYIQIFEERKEYIDSLLFGRLLLITAVLLIVDTLGWVIDGNPIGGQIWITTAVDGIDLILTTSVCWCWVQYVLYIVDGLKPKDIKWYKNFATYILITQIILVCSSQVFGFYYSVDGAGVYHREEGYIVHSLLSVILLMYSSGKSIFAYFKSKDANKKKEFLFVTFIILIPIAGNVFQLYVYGYPTVWLCTVFMVLTVFIHVQNKRVNLEREEQNMILKKALVQAQEANNAKTEFFSRMSHDMRTPMNGILGIANLSLDEESRDILLSNIRKIKTSGEYMLGLINDTLDFQKIESGKLVLEPSYISTREMLDSICSMVSETAKEKDINFVIENVNIDLGNYIKVDSLRIRQIFVNLLSNAIKFTPKGGTVQLKIENQGCEGTLYHDLITITDTGIGMSEDFLKNDIYKPFSQEYNSVTASTSGTGLGLSITKQLVELMGGKISVESEKGTGTKFEVSLYINRVKSEVLEKHTEARVEEKEFAQHMLDGRRMLLAEDHPLNAEIVIRLLGKMKCSIEWAKNGEECVEMFANHPENYYDLILMDIKMPVLDGLGATEKIRELSREDARSIPIIALTANAYEEDIRKSMNAGMNAHLAKPIDTQLMYNTIATWLDKRF